VPVKNKSDPVQAHPVIIIPFLNPDLRDIEEFLPRCLKRTSID